MADEQAPGLKVRGITLRDYNGWKHHPVTKLFRDYLVAKAADVQAATLSEWLAGGLELAVEQEARSTINAYEAMASLLGPDRSGDPRFGEIASFFEDVDGFKAQARNDADSEDDQPAEDQD